LKFESNGTSSVADLISIVSIVIDNISFPSLDIDILVALKYFFTWKKGRVTASVLPENDLPVTLTSHYSQRVAGTRTFLGIRWNLFAIMYKSRDIRDCICKKYDI